MTGNRTANRAFESVFAGDQLDRTDVLALIAKPADVLAGTGGAVRDFGDGTVDACSIVNAKAGNCAEDCGQSVHFDTGIDTYEFCPEE